MRICIFLFAFSYVLFAVPLMADREPPELSEYDRHDLRVTTICIEGHVVVVAHSDVGKSGGLGLMQLQEDVNGRIVPMRCNEERVRMSRRAGADRAESENPDSLAR